MTFLLVVDNHDSFTHNLDHALRQAGARTRVVANDAVTAGEVEAMGVDGLVLSPGPGHPAVPRDFGVCAPLLQAPFEGPVLGVCLGMQGMAQHTGGRVVASPEPVHGEATPVRLGRHPLFAGLPATIQAGRYHSLVVERASLPGDWDVVAEGEGGLVMAIAHRRLPWVGVQFHPESILTPEGPRIVENFVGMCA